MDNSEYTPNTFKQEVEMAIKLYPEPLPTNLFIEVCNNEAMEVITVSRDEVRD